MTYADNVTIISTHTSTSAAKKYMQPYLQKVFARTKHNNLILNPDKTTCTLFMPDPAEYTSNLDLKIHNNALPMATHPKVLGPLWSSVYQSALSVLLENTISVHDA